MNEILKVTTEGKKLRLEVVRPVESDDFAPAVDTASGAVNFITLLANESGWDFKEGNGKHTASLKIAFRYANDLKDEVDKLEKEGKIHIDSLTRNYLMDLWKVHGYTLSKTFTRGNESRSERAMAELKKQAPEVESDHYKAVVHKFNEAVNMINQI